MNEFDQLDPSLLLLFGFIGIVIMIAYPFAKGALLYASSRILKFSERSYWRAFFSVLIGVGLAIAVQSMTMMLSMRESMLTGQPPDPVSMSGVSIIGFALGFVAAFLSEAVAMRLFFKSESWGKILGAVALGFLFVFALYVLLIILVALVGFAFAAMFS